MTQCICRSLLAKKCFDAHDMASHFLDEYKQHGNRGYGSGMLLLFTKWDSDCGLGDPFLPAREQFSGMNCNIYQWFSNWCPQFPGGLQRLYGRLQEAAESFRL